MNAGTDPQIFRDLPGLRARVSFRYAHRRDRQWLAYRPESAPPQQLSRPLLDRDLQRARATAAMSRAAQFRNWQSSNSSACKTILRCLLRNPPFSNSQPSRELKAMRRTRAAFPPRRQTLAPKRVRLARWFPRRTAVRSALPRAVPGAAD